LAEEANLSVQHVTEALQANVSIVSLDKPVNEEEDSAFGDFLRDEAAVDPLEATENALDKEQVQVAIRSLNEQQQEILTHRFGLNGEEPKTLEEIGRILGVTRERIRQIENDALKKLRELKELEGLGEKKSSDEKPKEELKPRLVVVEENPGPFVLEEAITKLPGLSQHVFKRLRQQLADGIDDAEAVKRLTELYLFPQSRIEELGNLALAELMKMANKKGLKAEELQAIILDGQLENSQPLANKRVA